jgi:ubiquinone/menaquinone biosynthesis C-methylase UbiE
VAHADHFSGVARAYARYRPTYPAALFTFISGLTARHRCAWDCGAGNGQASEGLRPHFSAVVASDISRTQLASGAPRAGLHRVAAAAERCPLADSSIDLVTVAQALHWIDLPAFYSEVGRVVAPGGAIAAWSYDLALLGDVKLDGALRYFYDVTVGRYWPPERRMVDTGYREIPFPFTETAIPPFAMIADWTLDQLLGYVGTWSAVSRYRADSADDPVELLARQLESDWGSSETRRRIEWPLVVRAGRV